MDFKHKISTLLKPDFHLLEIIKGSTIAFFLKICSAGLAFFMNVIIARQIGAEQAGIFFLGFTIITIVATIGRVGLGNTLVRFIAAAHSKDNWQYINAMYRFGMCSSFMISLILALTVWSLSEFISVVIFKKQALIPVIQILALAIPFLALFTLHASAFQGLKKIPQNLFLLSLAVPLFFVSIASIYPIRSAIEASQYYLIMSAATLICGLLFWWFQKGSIKGYEAINLKKIMNSCIPLFAVQILTLFIAHTGQLFLGAWNSSADVAIFNAAHKTAMLTSFVLVAVNSISAPKFSAMHLQDDYNALAKLAVQSSRLMMILALPALLAMIFFPAFLLGLFGEDFQKGHLILIILALGQFINVATGSVVYLLIMTGNEKILRNNTLISAIISVSLGLWLIPVYGLMGAAISTTITVATANILSCWRVYQKLGFWTLPFSRPLPLIIVFLLLGLLIFYIIVAAHELSFIQLYFDSIQYLHHFFEKLSYSAIDIMSD